MKMPLKRHLGLFTQLRNRLSSVRWTLLLITTAMFFLSAASTGCPTGGYTLSVAPNLGPSVSNPPPPSNDQPPPPLPPPPLPPPPPSLPPPPDGQSSQTASQLPASASAPAIPVVIPATPEGSGAITNPVVTAPPPDGTTGLPPGGSAGNDPAAGSPVAVPPPSGTTDPPPGGGPVVIIKMVLDPKNPSGFAFSPETVTITKGTKVTWVNATAFPHTVTSNDGKFTSSSSASPVLQDQMYSFVFTTAGIFKYRCAIHPPQIGAITVQ